jgi:transcriptional regulator with XRE-family HTH domain
MFPVIDLVATGENITRLRKDRGLTVRDLQNWFGFEEPQAIYKWQKGKSLPTVDNLYALGALLDVPLEEILVPYKTQLNIVGAGQQDVSCCPDHLSGSFEYVRTSIPCYHYVRKISDAA